MKNISIILICLSISCSLNISLSAQTNVTINWNSPQGTVTTGRSYGLNCNRYFEPAVTTNSTYMSNLQFMNPKFLRFHDWAVMGWEIPGETGWMTPTDDWNEAKIIQALTPYKNNVPNAEIMMNIPEWPKKWFINSNPGSGPFGFANPKLQTNRYDDFATWCATLVTICKNNGFNIKYWELPNELEELYLWSDPNQYNQLLDIYTRAVKKMKLADPTIKVGGLAFTNDDGGQEFLQALAGKTNPILVDFYSEHKYPAGEGSGFGDPFWNVSAQTLYNDALTYFVDVPQAMEGRTNGYGRNIETYIDEFNISYAGGGEDLGITGYPGAVYNALAYTTAALNGVDGMHDWTEWDGNMGIEDADFNLRPRAYTLHMLTNYFIGSVATSSSSNPNNVRVFAVNSGSKKSVMLINTSNSSQNVALNFSGWSTAPSTFNSERIAPSGSGYGGTFTTGSIPYSTATNSYSIPANSVTTLYVTDGSGNVAVSGVTVSPTSTSITAGATEQLTANVSPADASNQNVTWSSSNTAVATVNTSGFVTAVAAGTATITVTTTDGAKTATSAITVTAGSSSSGVYYVYSDMGDSFIPDGGSFTTYAINVSNLTSGAAEGSNYRNFAVADHYASYMFLYSSAKNKSSWSSSFIEFNIRTTSNFDIFMEDYAGNRFDIPVSNYLEKSGAWESVSIPISAFSGVNLSQLKGFGFYNTWSAPINMDFDNVRITNGSILGPDLSEDTFQGIVIYPNPTSDIVTLHLGKHTGANISITDLLGKEILSRQTVSEVEKLDLSGSKGLLLLKVSLNNKVITEKLIVK